MKHIRSFNESSDSREANHIYWSELANGYKKDGMSPEEIVAKLEDMGLDSRQAERLAGEDTNEAIIDEAYSMDYIDEHGPVTILTENHMVTISQKVEGKIRKIWMNPKTWKKIIKDEL